MRHSLHVKVMIKAKETNANPSFYFSKEDNINTVTLNGVTIILDQPETVADTKRSSSQVVFGLDLDEFVIE